MKKNKKIFLIDIILLSIFLLIVILTKTPAKVEGLSIDDTTYNSVHLSWNKNKDSTGYSIYRAEKGKDYEYIDTTSKTSYEDVDLDTGKTYAYTVKAFKGLKKSDVSNEASATLTLDTPSIKADLTDGSMKISIDNVDGAEGYTVYRDDKKIETINLNIADEKEDESNTVESKDAFGIKSVNADKAEEKELPPQKIHLSNENSEITQTDKSVVYIDKTAESDKEYTYEVKAFRDTVESDSSKDMSLKLLSAGDIEAKVHDNSVLLSWSDDDYTNYKLYNKNELLTETTEKEYSLPVTDEEYDIKLIGFNEDGQSPESTRKFTVEEKPMDNKAAIQAAIDWAKEIAADDSFTYGKKPTTNRVGCYFCGTNQRNKPKGYEKTYVCMTFVTAAYAHGAQDPEVYSVCKNGKMCLSCTDSNFSRFDCWKKVGLCKNLSVSDLEPGDVIVWYDVSNGNDGHMSMYIGDGDICDASGGGWDAGSISVKPDRAQRYLNYRGNKQSSKNYVMRYTGNGSGTMKVIEDVKN